MLDALDAYNQTIARYALNVIPRDAAAEELAAALVVRQN
jgi:hypothetical protein